MNVLGPLYRYLLRPALFSIDPETVHHLVLGALSTSGLARWLVGGRRPVSDPVELMGLTFRNRLGLAAGFDKNAIAIAAWDALGFGFAEVGTVTAYPQQGNPRPRIFRVAEHEALVNRMGFPNEGATSVRRHLEAWRAKVGETDFVVGVNIGKSKITALEEAAEDYVFSFRQLRHLGDYFVINVSSPNTPGLRRLQDPEALRPIVEGIAQRNDGGVPLLVKIAPDLTDADVDAIAQLVTDCDLAGVVATNTTIDHSAVIDLLDEKGGLSGKPITRRSTEVVAQLREALPDRVIIGVGGVYRPDAYREKRLAGADLVQVYTGFIYAGPTIAFDIVEEP